jgi:hypothetical protein
VASIALLSSISLFQRSEILLPEIEHTVPLEKIMKIVSFQVEPIHMLSAVSSYMNAYKIMTQP